MAFDIYYALTKTEIPKVLQKQLAPLNPELSPGTFETLEKRAHYSIESLSEVQVIPPPAESDIIEEATEVDSVATETATATTGEIATGSGILE